MHKKPKAVLSAKFLLKLLITVIAYIYIYYRIKESFIDGNVINFSVFSQKSIFFVCLALLLVTPNWLLEAIKWRKLLSVIHDLTLYLAIKSTLIGITCSIFTPYRLGEYFGRPIILPKEKITSGVLANIIGSISQNIVTYGLGIIGAMLLIVTTPQNFTDSKTQTIIILTLVLLSSSLLAFYFHPSLLIKLAAKVWPANKHMEKLEFMKRYKQKDLFIILLIGFIRYTIFFTQYYCLLIAFGVNISIVEAFTAISLSYVFLFSIPGIPIADVGIRGSLALFFLGMYSLNDIGIVAASSILWVINLAIPAAMGSFFLIRHKKRAIHEYL